jgi:hypothetical protein
MQAAGGSALRLTTSFAAEISAGAATAAAENVRTAAQLGRHFDAVEAEVQLTELFTGAFAVFYRGALRGIVARHVGDAVETAVFVDFLGLGDASGTGLSRPWRGLVGACVGTFAAFPFDLVRTRQADALFMKQYEAGKGRRVSIGTVAKRGYDELFRGAGTGVVYAALHHILAGAAAAACEDWVARVLDTHAPRLAPLVPSSVLSELVAVSFASMILTPIEIAKKRIQNRASFQGLVPTLGVIYREGGISGLYAQVFTAPLESVLPALTRGLFARIFARLN